MNTNFNVFNTEVKKVTISITRKSLWDNYVTAWKDNSYGEYDVDCSLLHSLSQVAKVLAGGDNLNVYDLRKLFRAGYTCYLMGDAMQFFNNNDIHREIVVDDHGEKHVISHEDIQF